MRIRRPFGWGVLTLLDTEAGGEWPELRPGARYAAGPSVLCLVVRHAQDVDADLEAREDDDLISPFEVEVRCRVDALPPSPVDLVVELACPSGRLEVGDADRWDALELPPGRWTVSVRAEPPGAPERVDIWFRRIEGSTPP